ncbi:MAG: DUF6273 domain-containing protein [bacterium]|nr:DUF6273 domain-containing protein [bacterium]
MKFFMCLILMLLIPAVCFADFKEQNNNTDINLRGLKKGDIIKFGIYPQSAGGIVRPIEWIVLDIQDGRALVISRYGLEAKGFDEKTVDWRESSIRRWLNGPFSEYAFSKCSVSFAPHPETGDFVFLLSLAEAKKYFTCNNERICAPTPYSLRNWEDAMGPSCLWWLRTRSSSYDGFVCTVGGDGSLEPVSQITDGDRVARPAIWIRF